MTAQKSPAANGANPNTNCNHSIAHPLTIRLSNRAESWIDSAADDVATGVLQLFQLPPSLAKFYWLAFYAGQATHDESCSPQLAQLRWERNLWFYVAHSHGKTPGDFYSHATHELWAEAAA